MAVVDVLETRISTRARKWQESQNYLKHDCCRQNENYIPIKTTQSLKTEPRIKREISYILCKVHMCGNGHHPFHSRLETFLFCKPFPPQSKGKGSPYSITERRVPEMISVLGSQPAGDVSHKPGGRLPLLSAGPQLPSQPLIGLLPILLLGKQRHDGCEGNVTKGRFPLIPGM